jgi:hypothetical protein
MPTPKRLGSERIDSGRHTEDKPFKLAAAHRSKLLLGLRHVSDCNESDTCHTPRLALNGSIPILVNAYYQLKADRFMAGGNWTRGFAYQASLLSFTEQ